MATPTTDELTRKLNGTSSKIDCPECNDDPDLRPTCETCDTAGSIDFYAKFAEELYYAAFDAIRDLEEFRRTLKRNKTNAEHVLAAILKSCARH